MNKVLILSLSILVFATGCSSCSEDKKYEVMTRYGGWQARADETRSKVANCEASLHNFVRYEFDSIDRHIFDSEFPYWQKIHIYLNKNGIQKAKLYANPRESLRTEELYFNEGNLILARVREKGLRKEEGDTTGAREEYFFTQNVLVLALDTRGKRKDIADDSVKIRGVDFLNEAEQIKQIIAKKQIAL